MKKYGLIIDSTVYLNEELIKQKDIKVVSLNVSIHEESYKEVDITREWVIEKRKEGAKFQTSAPAPGAFLEAYEQMLEDYEHVFVLGLSKELSGTYQSSLLAVNMLDDPSKVTLFDTGSSAYGNELLVLRLLEMMEEEVALKDIKKHMQELIDRHKLLFTCENLFSLVSGGRLSGARAMIGTVLRVKPIIEMQEGKLVHIKSERTYQKVFELIGKRIKETVEDKKKLYVYITHTNSKKSGDLLKEYIEKVLPNAQITYTDLLGPVMTVHVGNKGFGIAWTYQD